MPLTEDQFKKAIEALSDDYEAIKDIAQAGNYFMTKDVQDILKAVVKFRDDAYTFLRESHITQNFNNN